MNRERRRRERALVVLGNKEKVGGEELRLRWSGGGGGGAKLRVVEIGIACGGDICFVRERVMICVLIYGVWKCRLWAVGGGGVFRVVCCNF